MDTGAWRTRSGGPIAICMQPAAQRHVDQMTDLSCEIGLVWSHESHDVMTLTHEPWTMVHGHGPYHGRFARDIDDVLYCKVLYVR